MKMRDEDICRVRGNQIAMIFQEPMTSLNPVYSIGRQLSETLVLHKNKTESEALKMACDLLSEVQIQDGEMRLKSYPHQFSGGMRQRVMIAMGMSCVPKLIIADEPTTALDVTIQLQLLELLRSLTQEYGTSLIIITHNLGVVARYADRINVMYAGRIVEKATAKDLYAKPKHPYTVGLMASVPRLDEDKKKKLVPIDGQPPDLLALPFGCAFHPRCEFADRKCRQETPELLNVEGNHQVACWKYVKK
jgi:oligopeptide/dipeptide ABC transporter ATP-binding protein